MKKFWFFFWIFFGFSIFQSKGQNLFRPSETNDAKTLSPYFFVQSKDPKIDLLPLKKTSVQASIAGMIAEVRLTQVYKNEGKNTLEALYVFPLSSRAAVHAMKMTVGKRTIEAQIKEKEKAKEVYEKAKKEGRTASLLEQQRPNVFQMNVANILPKDEIKVEVTYVETLIPEDQKYEFVFPTVVGPRYSNVPEENAPDTEKWTKNPYLHEGEKSPFSFDLQITIDAGIPISKISSPSHTDMGIEFLDKQKAKVSLPSSAKAGTKDFVLQYSLAGKEVQTGLLLYPGEKENFFLMMVEPPKETWMKEKLSREYIFIVDVSGSMHGFPLDVTKELMGNLFSQLKKNEFFNVLLFSGSNRTLSEASLPATKENIGKGMDFISSQFGGGGTELVPALKTALNLPRQKRTSRIIVIATDGYVAVEKESFELIRNELGKANFFSFGIGSSVNRFLMEGMARAGQGEAFIVLNPDQAEEKAKKFQTYISSPLLQNLKVSFDQFETYDVEPPSLPDLFSQKPVLVFGKYKGQPKGKITVTGKTASKDFLKTIQINEAQSSRENSALPYLWARNKIQRLVDFEKISPNDSQAKEVTTLGLQYHLMTDYTSFVAVDTEVRADGKKVVTVKQPLPMPEGVSDLAVGHTRALYPSKKLKVSRSLGGGIQGGLKFPGSVANETLAHASLPQVKMVKEKLKVSENVNREEVLLVLEKNLSEFQACFSNPDPTQVGLWNIQIRINSDGTPTTIKMVDSKAEKKPEFVCLLKKLNQIKFPKTQNQKEGKILLALKIVG